MKLKTFCLAFIGFGLSVAASAQDIERSDDTGYFYANKHVFEHIETARIPSGILADYGVRFADPNVYDGIDLPDTVLTNRAILEQLYSTLYSSQVVSLNPEVMPTPQTYYERWNSQNAVNQRLRMN